MKYFNSGILLITIAASLTLPACKKQLNVLPTTTEVDGNVITNLQSAKTTLNGVYYRFANAGVDNNTIPITQWDKVNEAFPSELAGLVTYPFGGSAVTDHLFTATDYSTAALWSYGYNLVNAANGFIKNIDPVSNIDAATKQEMIAEAKFLRAFGNTTLLLYFGQYNDPSSKYGIILRTDFVTAGSINLARSGVADAYTSILADIDAAIAALPDQNTQPYYANKWVAKLLKARLLINRATGTDYADVISLTQDIIAHSPFALEGNVKDIFQSKGLNSKEVMLGIQPYQNGGSAKYSDYLYYTQYVASDSLISLFNNDPRKPWTYSVTSKYGYVVNMIIKYYPGSVTTLSPNPVSDISYAFRLTEAYLLQAEALTTSGGDMGTAKTLLKTVMGHAGISDFSAVDAQTTKEGLQLMIVKEEMKNFFTEAGQDWFAVRRLPFATLQTLVPAIQTKDQLLLPIPQTELTANSLLTGMQNPGYQ